MYVAINFIAFTEQYRERFEQLFGTRAEGKEPPMHSTFKTYQVIAR
jgi:hypothetical protein